MGLFSFFQKKHNERVLVVSIGSSSVTGAFVTINEGTKPVVEKVANAQISVLQTVEPEKFERGMFTALGQVINKLHTADTHYHPNRVSVFLTSPWYVSQVRSAKLSRPSSFVVSKKTLDDLVLREKKAFEEEIKAGDSSIEKLRLIESKTVRVLLNGYPVIDPLSKNAREIDLSLYTAASPERILKAIEDQITRVCPHVSVSFTSFLTAAFYTLHSHFMQETNSLFVDVGGEVTDVTLIKDGAPVQSVSFPKGRNFMLRELSSGLDRSVDESITICTLYVEGKVEESLRSACEKILGQVKNSWLSDFQKSLFSVSNELSVPDKVFLTCHADVAPWFVETIRREEFQQYTLTEKEFSVVLLDGQFFHDDIVHTNGVLRNPFIMMETLFLARVAHDAREHTK